MNLSDQLTKFRETYRSTNVMQYEDCLVYSFGGKQIKRWTEEINELIEKLNLDLVAIPSFKKVFVQSIHHSDL